MASAIVEWARSSLGLDLGRTIRHGACRISPERNRVMVERPVGEVAGNASAVDTRL